MKKTLLALLLGTMIALPAMAQDSYTADPSHTYPHFEVSHLGFSIMHGRFDKTTVKVTLDRAAKKGSIDVSVDTASANTGWAKRDDHLKSEDFFNVAKFPTMSFKSSNLKFDGDRLVGAEGELSLLGVTKPLTLAVSNFRCGPHPMMKKEMCGADATASLKRSDFGMKYGLPAIGDEVSIKIEIEAMKD